MGIDGRGLESVDTSNSVIFIGKKKSSKKKDNCNIFTALSEEAGVGSDVMDVVEHEKSNTGNGKIEALDSEVMKSKEVPETSKSRKKKTGRTAQEEDDLDKILSELGEGCSTSKPAALPKQEEKVEVEPDLVASVDGPAEKDGEEEVPPTVLSAAAKKKKKKKEKEKEKKAAAAGDATSSVDVNDENHEETEIERTEPKTNQVKGKAAEKKVPKHVREMQEALARRNEQEDRRRREEEERQRREEEERLRLEELERQREDVRRRKREREREKLLKKRLEGKPITAKEKEEACQLEAMRNQILANAAETIAPNGVAPAKAVENIEEEEEENQQHTVPRLDSVECDKVEEVESTYIEEKSDIAESVKKNGMEGEAEEENDDVDEWDAKSWDDSAVNLSLKHGFSDEEIDSKPEPVVKKHIKSAGAKPTVSAEKNVPTQSIKSQNVENKKKSGRKMLLKKKQQLQMLPQKREGEAGGITQQIGATYFPAENIRERTKELRADVKLKVPGLLVIDTPGHESFTNLQSRGSGLCDIAVLVVDIMHGLEPQTIESLNLLKMRNTKFIVALNKVDRLYGWKTCRNAPIEKAMKQQSKDVKIQFETQLVQIITQFKEQGLNTELNNMDKKMRETYRIVPTSAISGEGIPDLLLVLAKLTEKTMVENLTYRNEVQCTVLEVKVIEGLGTTIDVVLVNGVLHEGDQIVVCGIQGPIVTSIRALLTPHPMNELRVKGTYQNHRAIKGAQGIKITAPGLEHAIAGAALYVVGPHDDLEEVKETAMGDMKSVLSRIDKSGEGVCVQAYTLGSLEALLEFLKTPEVNIPVSGISIGTVHKKDVMKASVMLEKKKEFATILAFDVKVTPEAWKLADDLGVKIFMADIIYHLFDQFKGYINNLKEEKKKESSDEAVFPSVIKILPNSVFNKKDPILLGVDVLEGILKVGTPICIPQRDFITIGRIASIKNNHRPVDIAKKGMKVSIKIIGTNPDEQQKMYGRHFGIEDELVSHITRRSIDALKANYRDELSNDEWKLVVKLKKLFEIL
ncbi:unnamed protein product [Prunus armeniaca]